MSFTMKKLKIELLKILTHDEDIRQLIKRLASSDNETEDVQQDAAPLHEVQKELQESQIMIAKLKKLIGISENNLNSQASDIKQLRESLKSNEKEKAALTKSFNRQQVQLKRYEDLFKDEIATHQAFMSLSSSTKKSLSGIFKDDSLQGFMACGIQEKSINNLWEYLKNEVIEDSNEDLPALTDIFDFLFSRYVIAYPIYERQPLKVGDEFDPQQHIKHSSSNNVSGKIQKIILHGWKNKKTKKLIKQSVVII